MKLEKARKIRIIVVAIALILVTVLNYIPKAFSIYKLNKQINGIKEELKNVDSEKRILEKFNLEEEQKIEDFMVYFRERLPVSSDSSIPVFLENLERLADEAELADINFKQLDAGASSGDISEVSMMIDLQAEYHSLLTFLSSLNEFNRLISVKSLEITRNDSILPYLEVLLKVTIYTISDKDEDA